MTATQLRAWRERRGWTQEQAAEATGYTIDAWKSWELGRRPIRAPLMRMLKLLEARC